MHRILSGSLPARGGRGDLRGGIRPRSRQPRGQGARYRVISALETGTKRILVDRGVMPTEGEPPVHAGPVTVTGNLHWPDEIDGFTPGADLARNIWYARDVDALAAHLDTAPILVIARDLSVSDAPLTPAARGHQRHSERSPELRDHLVFAGRALDGDDTLSSVAYQAETHLRRGAMRYVSTRGRAPELTFEEAMLTGLARDGGLYVPERCRR
jgi:cytochrome oxidase assembly protein ShyY1